jgi:hypothetical protein
VHGGATERGRESVLCLKGEFMSKRFQAMTTKWDLREFCRNKSFNIKERYDAILGKKKYDDHKEFLINMIYETLANIDNAISGNLVDGDLNKPLPIVDITNIGDYIMEIVMQEKERKKFENKLNAIPPFGNMIFKMGGLILFCESMKWWDNGHRIDISLFSKEESGFLLYAKLICSMVGHDGSSVRKGISYSLSEIKNKQTGEWRELTDNDILPSLYIVLFSMTLMHVKGLNIIKNQPKEKVNKKRISENRKPFDKYFILDINPFKTRVKNIANKNKCTTTIALHLVMQHLKDYRDGPGLGKHHAHGMWLWRARVAGDEKKGKNIRLGYNIKSPFEQIAEG